MSIINNQFKFKTTILRNSKKKDLLYKKKIFIVTQERMKRQISNTEERTHARWS